MEIGIFGVTANPVHLGHLRVVEYSSQQADQIWITPVFQHPFGKKFVDYPLRKKMLELLFEEFPVPNAKIMELDRDYWEKYDKMVYSYDLLVYLKEQYPQHNFKLIIGEDNYQPQVWTKFYNYQEIEKEFGLIVVPDNGAHSTNIREMLKNGQNAAKLVGNKVQDFITTHNLYKED